MPRVTHEINHWDAWVVAREVMLRVKGSRAVATDLDHARAAESIHLGIFNALESLRCGLDPLGFRMGKNQKYYFSVSPAGEAAARYIAHGLAANHDAGYRFFAQYGRHSETSARFYVTTQLIHGLVTLPLLANQPHRPLYENAKINIRGEYVGRDRDQVWFYPPPAP